MECPTVLCPTVAMMGLTPSGGSGRRWSCPPTPTTLRPPRHGSGTIRRSGSKGSSPKVPAPHTGQASAAGSRSKLREPVDVVVGAVLGDPRQPDALILGR